MALFGTDPLEELLVPDGTHAQEHDLVTDGDVIVASQSTVEFGVRGGNVIAGERVEFGGDIEAEGDCRLDTWCEVAGNVLVGEDAYLGERAHIGGELRVAGNLDIGDDVQIDDGFEANGWIVIRNPMPTIVFLFIYLSQLLRIGEQDAAEQLLDAVTDADEREHDPVLVPRGSRVGDDAWRVSTPGRVGDDCRLHGNIRAESLVVGRENELFGSLRAREGITVGAGTEVTGNVTTREGTVRIGPGVTVRGDVAGEFVEVHREADIEGAIRASEEMSIVSDPVLDDAAVSGADDPAGSGERAPESTPTTDADDPEGIGADEPGEGETDVVERGETEPDGSADLPTAETPTEHGSVDGTRPGEVPFAGTSVDTAEGEPRTGAGEADGSDAGTGADGTGEDESETGEDEMPGEDGETGIPVEEAERRGTQDSDGPAVDSGPSTTGGSNDGTETDEEGEGDSVPGTSPETASDSG